MKDRCAAVSDSKCSRRLSRSVADVRTNVIQNGGVPYAVLSHAGDPDDKHGAEGIRAKNLAKGTRPGRSAQSSPTNSCSCDVFVLVRISRSRFTDTITIHAHYAILKTRAGFGWPFSST